MVNGRIYGMKLRVDKSGRLVLPKGLRSRLGAERTGIVEVIEQPDGILLKPVQQQPSMLQIGGVWVHQGVAEPGTNWQTILDDIREERIQDILKS